jgi:NitT/TauT family transport system permease protein
VWWFVTRGSATEAIVSPAKLPKPGGVFLSYERDVYDMDAERDASGRRVKRVVSTNTLSSLTKADLPDAIWATMRRVLAGVAMAALVGIGLGVLAGSFRAVSAALNPLLIFLRSVPMGALLPLTVVWFGVGESQKEKFIFLAVVPFVFSDVLKAIAAVPQRYVETAETLGASKGQIIRKVLFPLALPDIVTSLRFQLGLALGYITLAEAINAKSGLGEMINARQRIDAPEEMFLLLFLIALIAFSLDALIRFFQRGIFHYRKDL